MHPQGKDETKVKAYERLLQYVTFWTTSDEESATVPSTARQLVLAQALRDEMTELGISAVRLSDTGYVYGIIPATPGYEDRPARDLPGARLSLRTERPCWERTIRRASPKS